jgi:hypothetical protein
MDYPLLVSTPISDHMPLRLFVFITTRTSHHRSDCLHECKDYKTIKTICVETSVHEYEIVSATINQSEHVTRTPWRVYIKILCCLHVC